ncbi:MAG: 6-carboxytetrahydropterin synthase QueD [Chloroflexota bacterium]
MFEVSVREHFDAAHFLRDYGGKCENLHGHRYEVIATVRALEVDEIGLAFDFGELRRHVREVLSCFDHACLNEVSPFDRVNPSSENIATTICRELQERGLPMVQVQVFESPDSFVTYTPPKLP